MNPHTKANPPEPPSELHLHPDFKRRVSEFGDWLDRYIYHGPAKHFGRHQRLRLCLYAFIITAGLIVIHVAALSVPASITSMLALCTLCLVAAILEHQRSLCVCSTHRDMELRFLAKLVHELEYERRSARGE